VLHKNTLIAFAAAVALGCIPVATTASAAGHPGGHAGGGHAMGGHAMAGPARGGVTAGYGRGDRIVRSGGRYYGGGPVYDSCPGNGYGPGYGYGYSNGCPGYGVPVVGGVINGILGGYGY
jgi:hypothetical protein